MSNIKKISVINFINPVFERENNDEYSVNTPLLENNIKYSYNFYYKLSIISFLFCFPLSIFSFYYCHKAKKLYKLGLNDKANNLIESSYLLSISSIIIGIISFLYLYCTIKINDI